MSPRRLFRLLASRLLPILFGTLLGTLCAHAFAQSDPPARVARLNHMEGPVTFAPAGDNEFTDAELNRPLVRGDRLWTDKGSRAEIQAGSAAVRMDGQTQLQLLALDDQSTQLSVTQGTLYVRVRNLPEGENFEVDTPNLAWRASYPGDYRIDVNAAMGTTRVTIHSGTGAVYGDKGQSLAMGGGQQITFRLRTLAQVNTQESPPQDNFDRWAAERNRREDQSVAARYLPREVVGYQQLDTGGQWTQDPTHGAVWFPQATPANWAPFRNGRWEWIAPWGWTWIDEAPWGFVTSHYGRWASIGNRWAWVPGRMGLRPMYAPALVAFVGGSGTTPTLPLGGGKQGIAWFPLAPGEAWQPGYRATPLYISTINSNMSPLPSGNYAYLRKPEAVTVVAAEDFSRGRPLRGGVHVAGSVIAQAQVVAPPPMPDRPNRALAKAPSASADIRQVASTRAAALQQQQLAEAQQAFAREQALKAEQAKAEQAKVEQAKAEQVRLAQQATIAEQARAAQQAKAAEQAKAEQVRLAQQKLAEQAKAAQQAKAVEQARAEQAKAEEAKAEQARLAQQAKLTQQAKAAEQARLTEQSKAADQARLAEQLRQAERNKLAEKSRAAEQARAAAQAKAAEQSRIAQQQARAAEQARAAQQARAAEQARAALARAEQARAAQQARAAEQARTAAQAQARQQEQLQARRAEQLRRDALAHRAEAARRDQLAKREQARREQVALAQVRREQAAAARAQSQRELQARKAEQARRVAADRRDEQTRKLAHAQQVEAARRAAEQDAQVLRDQRQKRDDAARRQAEDRELAQREAWQRQQQVMAEQWRRDQQVWEQQQRERARQRPDLRNDRRNPPAEPEIWQRGIPILNPGRTS